MPREKATHSPEEPQQPLSFTERLQQAGSVKDVLTIHFESQREGYGGTPARLQEVGERLLQLDDVDKASQFAILAEQAKQVKRTEDSTEIFREGINKLEVVLDESGRNSLKVAHMSEANNEQFSRSASRIENAIEEFSRPVSHLLEATHTISDASTRMDGAAGTMHQASVNMLNSRQ